MNEELTEDDYRRAAEELGVDVATVKAVAEVESHGSGFLPDGRPQILYEAHLFHRHTSGRYGGIRDRNGRLLSAISWDRSLYGPAGAQQHDRLSDAAQLDWEAAHKAASWGKFQIMGANHRPSGFPTLKAFVEAMHRDVQAHFDAFIKFIKNNNLAALLRNRDWTGFARRYNGPSFAKNHYDTKLAAAYRRFATQQA